VDFFSYNPKQKFDIVYSFGFIEHFIEYKFVIEQHCKLVNENGILFIAVPNFRGKIQYFLHRLLDKENLRRHNIESMELRNWEQSLTENGFEIIQKGYIGSFDFWIEISKKTYLKILIRKIIVLLIPIFRRILSKPSESYSPYCGIIAKKTTNKNI
jgi:hypothetical protein